MKIKDVSKDVPKLDEVQTIRSNRRSYSSAIPHIADDELNLYEYRLYGHYCRVYDSGSPCVERVRVTAKHCDMSASTIGAAREGLAVKGYIELHKSGAGRKARCFVTLLDVEERNLMHCKRVEESQKNDRGKNILDQNTPENDRGKNILSCTTTTVEEEDPITESNCIGSSSAAVAVTVVQKTAQVETLTVLGHEMLEECSIFPADALLFASQHPFEHLRQWVFDWWNNPLRRGPGLLKHIIDNDCRRGELTSEDRRTDFYQRYRTPDEIERDRLDELLCLEAPPVGTRPPASSPPVTRPEAGALWARARDCPDPEACAAWETLQGELQMQLLPEIYNAWVRNAWLIERIRDGDADLWVIGLPSARAMDWLQNRLSNKIRRTLSSLVHHAVTLEFRVRP